jgi:hypothetical protein
MATAQVNGSSLTSNGYGSFLQANNRHGTIKANGTSTSDVVENVKTVSPKVTTFGSTVIENTVTTSDYAGKAITGGTFAHNHVKPISSLVTDEIAGVSTNVIKTPGNDGDTIRGINSISSVRTRQFTSAIRANKYNPYDNTFAGGYPAVQVDSFGTDEAATPTASVPGELTYLQGSVTPYNANYKAKTNY